MPVNVVAKVAITAAMTAAQMALTMSQRIKGPRLETLDVTLADYGTPIPRFWGTRRFEVPIIWAEKLREEKHTSKTKGGKYEQYRYYGSWAVLICDHEIEAVTRIWFDKRLVYDATRAGPTSAATLVLSALRSNSNIKLSSGNNMRIYLGTEDQMPDPRIEAWCEDRYGADSCPAYRGSAYIVFEDIPLEKVGNRIPQITVEAVSAKTDAFPYETKESLTQIQHMNWSPDGTRMISVLDDSFDLWDVPTRTRIRSGTKDEFYTSITPAFGDDGRIYVANPDVAGFYSFDSDMNNGILLTTGGTYYGGHAFNVLGHICFLPYIGSNYALVLTDGNVASEATGFEPDHYFGDLDDNVWAIGNNGTSVELQCIVGTRYGDVVTVATGIASNPPYGMVNEAGEFVIFQHNSIFRVNSTTGAIVETLATTLTFLSRSGMSYVPPGAPTVWVGTREFDTADLALIRNVDMEDWSSDFFSATFVRYDKINHALVQTIDLGFNIDVSWLFLDRIAGAGVTLKTVVDDVSEWCGLTDRDTNALTQTVQGYSVTQGSGKDMLAPLLDIHDVDARPHDFGVQFVNRGSAPSGTILTADMVREGDEARYKVAIQQDTDLPRRVSVTFADKGKDQQPNTAVAQRPQDATDSRREETIDLSTWVDTPAGAQQKVDRYFRRQWNSRERISNAVTAQKLGLEPGDVTTISLDGVLRNVRLDRMTIRKSRIDCEFIRDETSFAAVNSTTDGAEMGGRDEEVIFIPGPTKGIPLDIPLVDDGDSSSSPILYIAAGPYGTAWMGATVERTDTDELLETIDSSNRITWGVATTALATVSTPWMWDRSNSVTVEVFGELTSATEAALNADPSLNMIALGAQGRWELIQFATATLTGTAGNANVYALSGFKRGRRGTEGQIATHQVGDTLVLLTQVQAVAMGADDVGDAMTIAIQSIGRDSASATTTDLTFTGASLKPYAPVIARVAKESTGDITITIRTRTRIGANWNGGPIPDGETIDSYEFDVYRAGVFKRKLTSSTKSFTYTAAQQTTDGGLIAASALQGNAYQLSASVGRGFARAA